MAPDGHSLLVGTRKGQLVQYDIVAAGGAAALPPPAAQGAAAASEQQQAAADEQPERHQQTAAQPAAAEQQQKAAAAAVCIREGSRRELVLQGASHSDPIDCLVSWAPGWGLEPGGGTAGEHPRVMLAAPMPTTVGFQTSAAFNCRIRSACCCLPPPALLARWPGGDQVQRWPHVRLALCQ